MGDDVPIRNLKPLFIICIVMVALAIAFVSDKFIYPDHERIVFFAAFMSTVAAYSCIDMLKMPKILVFVAAYAVLHLLLCLVGPPDSTYYGAVLIPAGILDYAASVYFVYFLYKRR